MKLFNVVLFLGFIGGIMGLKCYTCTTGSGASTDTSACGDPFDKSTTDANVHDITCADISADFDVCAKTKVTGSGTEVVARTCFSSSACPTQNGCASGDFGGATAEVCCCSGSNCNGVGSVVVNVVSTVALVFAAVVFTL